MKFASMCSVCSVFEWLQLKWVGPMMLLGSSILAVLSLFVWPLLFIWPVSFVAGLGLTAGYGACTECHISV